MTYRGRVKNGVIVLDDPASLPDGTEVAIQPLGADEKQIPTIYERYEAFIGIAKGLPSDASINHDHYLYGTLKK